MNRHLNKMNSRLGAKVAIITLVTAIANTSFAATDITISDQPLELGSGVEPNLLIINDDSGSMDWEVTSSDVSYSDRSYFYNFSNEYSATGGLKTDLFAHSSHFNKIYYNPDTVYSPWKGLAPNGAEFPASDYTNAPSEAYFSEEISYLNLSTDNRSFYAIWKGGEGDDTQDNNNYTKVPLYLGNAGNRSDSTLTQASLFNRPSSRSDCAAASGAAIGGRIICTYDEELSNYANWFTYYRRREFVAKSVIGRVVDQSEGIRLGYTTINYDDSKYNGQVDPRYPVASMNGSSDTGAKKELLHKMYSTISKSGTPLRQALDKAGRYFSCKNSNGLVSGASSPGDVNCPVVSEDDGGACQQNYALLISDGFYNGSSVSVGNLDQDGSGTFDGGAYADSRSNTLADIAMKYYESDLHSALSNSVPMTVRDLAGDLTTADPAPVSMHQHMATYTVGFGVNGTLDANPTDYKTAFNWPNPSNGDPEKIDDMRHAAFNGRGEFLSANNSDELTAAIKEIFDSIKRDSGAASAVAFNTQEFTNNSVLYRAVFNSRYASGNLYAQSIDIDGNIDENFKWRAAEQLSTHEASQGANRVIVTYDPSLTTNARPIEFNLSNVLAMPGTSFLDGDQIDYLRGDRSNEKPSGSLRERPRSEYGLGDIIHSTPLYVGEPLGVNRDVAPYPTDSADLYSTFKKAQQNRLGAVYVGANDGMMHAFSAETGSELFAYVPSNSLLDPTHDLSDFTDPLYVHKFYVDLSPTQDDVFISTKNDNTKEWRTVLFGGLGAGGRGYFAIDITNVDAFADAAKSTAAKVDLLKTNVLWEFTALDDSDLGLSYSVPEVGLSRFTDSNGDKEWVSIFGNGYNSNAGDASLFINKIEGGNDGVWSKSDKSSGIFVERDYHVIDVAGPLSNGQKNGLSKIVAVDNINGISDGVIDYVYAGDLAGDLFRFDLTDDDSENWNATKIFDGSEDQPITIQPAISNHPNGGFVIAFGSGSWMANGDLDSTETQAVYTVWDDLSTTASDWPVVKGDLLEQTANNVYDPITDRHLRTSSANQIEWNGLGSGGSWENHRGWYLDFDITTEGSNTVDFPGEKAVRNMIFIDDLLVFVTVIPEQAKSCVPGIGSYLMAIDALSGAKPERNIFDVNKDGQFSDDDNVGGQIVTGVSIDGTASEVSFIGKEAFAQTTDSEGNAIIREKLNIFLQEPKTGRVSWRECQDMRCSE